MCSGGGGGGTQIIRYYSGIENTFDALTSRALPIVDSLYLNSPYATGFDVIKPEDAFFGIGYIVSDFPSEFDIFGKFMAGLDIEVLRTQIQNDFVTGTVAENVKAINREILNDETDNVILPKLKASLQSMNAVMASSFPDSIGTVHSNQLKRINEYNANIDMKMLDMGTNWAMKHLEWNALVMTHYNKIINDYLQSNANYLSTKSQITTLDKLWPFTILDQYRAMVGVLNGASAAHVQKDSPFTQAVQGVVGTANFLASPTGNWLTNALGITGAAAGVGLGAGAAGAGAAEAASAIAATSFVETGVPAAALAVLAI